MWNVVCACVIEREKERGGERAREDVSLDIRRSLNILKDF